MREEIHAHEPRRIPLILAPERRGRWGALLNYRLRMVFAGHVGRRYRPPGEMHARLAALLERMAIL